MSGLEEDTSFTEEFVPLSPPPHSSTTGPIPDDWVREGEGKDGERRYGRGASEQDDDRGERDLRSTLSADITA